MKKLTHDQQRFLEGYSAALQDIEYRMTGDNGCSKAYDPMKCEEEIMHSYAFNMKDGGRHHPVKDYEDLEDIKRILLNETAWNIAENQILEN
jgi:hypothetical protein